MSSCDGVVGGTQRGVLALGVLGVAQRLVALHRRGVGAQLGGAALGALLGAGGEEHLHRRLGRHDGADVAALGHPVAVVQQRALLLHERGAHLLVGGDPRGGLRYLGRADRLGHVAAVGHHPVAQLDLQLLGALGRGAALLEQLQRRRAVHRPGVEVGEAERPRRRARHRALARLRPARRSPPPSWLRLRATSAARSLGPSSAVSAAARTARRRRSPRARPR